MVEACPFDLDDAQLVVPGLLSLLEGLVEPVAADFHLQVFLGLLRADIGGAQLHGHGSRTRGEGDDPLFFIYYLGIGVGLIQNAVDVHPRRAVDPGGAVFALAVHVVGVGRKAAVAGEDEAAAGPLTVENQVAVFAVGREGEAAVHGVGGGGHLHFHPRGRRPFLKGHAVIMGFGLFLFMGEFGRPPVGADVCAFRRHGEIDIGVGHELPGAPVSQPGGGGVLDGHVAQLIFAARQLIEVGKGAVGFGLGRVAVEAVGQGDQGRGDTPGVGQAVVGAPQDIDIIGQMVVHGIRLVLNENVVEVSLEGRVFARLVFGLVVADQDFFNGLALCNRADIRGDLIPLHVGQHPGFALGLGSQDIAVLIPGAQLAQVGAVGKLQIDGHMFGRVFKVIVRVVRARQSGEEDVAQTGVGFYGDGQIVVKDVVAEGLAFADMPSPNLQRAPAGPAGGGQRAVGAGGATALACEHGGGLRRRRVVKLS